MNLTLPEKIFLCGFMGSGKTTCGKKLASEIGYPFYDLDQVIEHHEKKTISSIFREIGETGFRAMELEYLQSFLDKDAYVLSLGGGTLCITGIAEKIKNNGLLIYLKAEIPLLVERLSGAENRPMLIDNSGVMRDGSSLEYYIRDLLATRDQWYRKAQLVIDIRAGMDVDNIVSRIIKDMKEFEYRT